MITLKVSDLEQQNISVKKGSEITFQNKIYKHQRIVAKREEEKIPQITEEYILDNLECILLEHKLFFSLWLEKTDEIKVAETPIGKKNTKKIIKQYRGISYEVEIPEDNAQNISVDNGKRKYRGKYY